MKHSIIPTAEQLPAIDRNDPEMQDGALELEWPETFSIRAKMVLKALDGTAFLYHYKGHFVVTDESMDLTEFGNGTREAPWGCPRCEAGSLEEVEEWLEDVANAYDADIEDFPEWAEIKAEYGQQ